MRGAYERVVRRKIATRNGPSNREVAAITNGFDVVPSDLLPDRKGEIGRKWAENPDDDEKENVPKITVFSLTEEHFEDYDPLEERLDDDNRRYFVSDEDED